MVTATMSKELYDPVIRLLELLDRPAVREALIRQEICWRILLSPLGPVLQQVGLKDSDTARMGRVTTRMQSNYQQPFRVADLAVMRSSVAIESGG